MHFLMISIRCYYKSSIKMRKIKLKTNPFGRTRWFKAQLVACTDIYRDLWWRDFLWSQGSIFTYHLSIKLPTPVPHHFRYQLPWSTLYCVTCHFLFMSDHYLILLYFVLFSTPINIASHLPSVLSTHFCRPRIFYFCTNITFLKI